MRFNTTEGAHRCERSPPCSAWLARCWPLNLKCSETWPTPSPRTNDKPWMSIVPPRAKTIQSSSGFMAAGKHRAKKGACRREPQALVDKGLVFVSINDRFVPHASLKEIAGDVAKAIRWVHDHAQDYRGDPNSIIVMGHSGGYRSGRPGLHRRAIPKGRRAAAIDHQRLRAGRRRLLRRAQAGERYSGAAPPIPSRPSSAARKKLNGNCRPCGRTSPKTRTSPRF